MRTYDLIVEEANPNREELNEIAAVLVQLAFADGVFAEGEREMIAGTLSHYGAEAGLEQLQQHLGRPIVYESLVHHDLVLALCLMLAYADGEFSAPEAQYVEALASRLQVGEASLGELHQVVKRKIFSSVVSAVVSQERTGASEEQDLDLEEVRRSLEIDEDFAREEYLTARKTFFRVEQTERRPRTSGATSDSQGAKGKP